MTISRDMPLSPGVRPRLPGQGTFRHACLYFPAAAAKPDDDK